MQCEKRTKKVGPVFRLCVARDFSVCSKSNREIPHPDRDLYIRMSGSLELGLDQLDPDLTLLAIKARKLDVHSDKEMQ